MKRTIAFSICVLMLIFSLCACSSGKQSSGKSTAGSGEELAGKHHVEIVIKDYGTLKAELDADSAPITVKNFIDLASSGFYDGLTFHRIFEGFVIQGGDPQGNGTGGSGKTIKGEFAENGVDNRLSHTRGAISMARASGDMDSASSQFFICQQDCSSSLDGQYAVFGYVTSGMDIVDRICQTVENADLVPENERPVIETIKVID